MWGRLALPLPLFSEKYHTEKSQETKRPQCLSTIYQKKMEIFTWINNGSLLKLLEPLLIFFFTFWPSCVSCLHFAGRRKHEKPAQQEVAPPEVLCASSLGRQEHWRWLRQFPAKEPTTNQQHAKDLTLSWSLR